MKIEQGRVELSGIMGPYDISRVAGRESAAMNPDYCKDTANTTLNLHNGKLLAAWYNSGRVHALDPLTLETSGEETFHGGLDTSLNAHGKVDVRTNEYINYGYADFQSWLTYYVIGSDGRVKHKTRIDLPGPRLPHDTTITPNYTILHDFPLFHDPALLRKTGHRVVQFRRDIPSRFGVMPRYGTQEQVRWFEFEPGYVLHMVNAWEEGDWIIMDGCFQPDPTIKRDPSEGPLGSMLAYLRYKGHLRRWRMNLKTGECSEEQLDDLNVEFCLPDMDLYGVKSRYFLSPADPDRPANPRIRGSREVRPRKKYARGLPLPSRLVPERNHLLEEHPRRRRRSGLLRYPRDQYRGLPVGSMDIRRQEHHRRSHHSDIDTGTSSSWLPRSLVLRTRSLAEGGRSTITGSSLNHWQRSLAAALP
jgi:hypothetical protein